MSSINQSFKPALLGILLLALSGAAAQAGGVVVAPPAPSPARGFYVGVFGGGGIADPGTVTQLGTAFFIEAAGGPLAVNAKGQPGTSGVGMVGGQAGYEWAIGPRLLALEVEGLYLPDSRRVTVNNPTLRLDEHTFDNNFPMRNAVFLANVVLSFPMGWQGVTPYVGGGFGAARVSVKGATSTQIAPPEPGINHFNSGPDSTAWTFAAQAKAGVRVALASNVYLFGEYRYLYVGANDQTFGPTDYPTHAPTSAWTVRFEETSHHLGVVGIGVSF